MHVGVTLHLTDRSIDIVDLAREVEARGFRSLYVPEHTHIPTSRQSPAPTGTPELDEQYYRSPDPYVALAAAAAVTEQIRLGTGIALVIQHDPIALAKTIASLDHVSGGRFVLGIGYGWNREEMANHGIEFGRRRDMVREWVLAMQQLWAHDEAEFRGEFVAYEPSAAWPKPVQQPSPPVLLGGAPGPTLIAHVAEFGHGWIPIGGAGVRDSIPDFRAAYEAAGRDPDTFRVVPFGTHPDEAKLAYYTELGCDEVVLRLPSAPRDRVLPVLDDYVRFLTAT
ncbi:MAG: LLM class F420-dependent oxidoreductase [Acidimicrobiia bacterium]|nr:LLM class F420-dependent oxidoreductase [Acidimicrobiia bacterium]